MNDWRKMLNLSILLVILVFGCGGGGTFFVSETERSAALSDFQQCELVPEYRWKFVFEERKFPKIKWKYPYLVEKAMGKFPLKTRWFDAELNEVAEAKEPGRYAAVMFKWPEDNGEHFHAEIPTFPVKDDDAYLATRIVPGGAWQRQSTVTAFGVFGHTDSAPEQ